MGNETLICLDDFLTWKPSWVYLPRCHKKSHELPRGILWSQCIRYCPCRSFWRRSHKTLLCLPTWSWSRIRAWRPEKSKLGQNTVLAIWAAIKTLEEDLQIESNGSPLSLSFKSHGCDLWREPAVRTVLLEASVPRHDGVYAVVCVLWQTNGKFTHHIQCWCKHKDWSVNNNFPIAKPRRYSRSSLERPLLLLGLAPMVLEDSFSVSSLY